MNEKEKRFLSYWEEKQRNGRIRFAILNGILLGSFVFIVMTCIGYLFDNTLGTRNELLLNLVLLVIGGMFYEGGFTWWANSRRYKKLTQN